MYIKSISIKGLGPISDFNLELPFDSTGKPQPVAIIGTNGSGKTLLLANLLDGLIELKRKIFTSLKEVESSNYLKIGSKSYIKNSHDTSFVNILFQSTSSFSYVDVASKLMGNEFLQKHPRHAVIFPGLDINNKEFKEGGFFKNISITNSAIAQIRQDFVNSVVAFFPHSRYDHPAWLTKSYEVGFKMDEKFYGQDPESIIKKSDVQEVESWMLDVLLDRALYEQKHQSVFLPPLSNPTMIDAFVQVDGKNSRILSAMNNILTIIFKEKFPDIQFARIGASRKNQRSVSIILRYSDGNEQEVANKFSFLSSGEALLIALFGSILKSFDFKANDKMENISGIVIIDEIDLHLHLSMVRKTLPRLMQLFPKIQFIFSTHSPFLLLGLREILGDKFLLVNMPTGNFITINDFSETREAYNVFVRGYNDFYTMYKALENTIQNSSKPLIITEGKTDWKHIKNALTHFQENGEYSELDVDFLEYNSEIEMGDTALEQLCTHYSKIQQPRRIIGIFDRDNKKIISNTTTTKGYKNWGNNVYSFCIPKPPHRVDYENISIEFYYTDDEIKTKDRESLTRLFFSNEISELIEKDLTDNKSKTSYKVLDVPISIKEKYKKIFDQDCSQIKDDSGVTLAHSKTAFAEKVYRHKNGYDSFNLDAFKLILDVIVNIANDKQQ